MRQIIDTHKENLPLYVLLFYILGYAYLKTYYSRFGIDIEYYISLTDMLFFTVKSLIYTSISLLIIEVLLLLLGGFIISKAVKYKYRKHLENLSQTEKEAFLSSKHSEHYVGISLLLALILGILGTCFTEEYLYGTFYMLGILMIKFYFMMRKIDLEKNDKEGIELNNKIFIAFLLGLLVVANIMFGLKDAKDLKKSIFYFAPKQVTFCYDDTQYSTMGNSNLTYIGETSDYLFIYDNSQRTSQSFQKSLLVNFTFVDPTVETTEERIEREKIEKDVQEFLKNLRSRDTVKVN